ncbi:MAG TPA: hypothetical protein VFI93_07120 [Rhizomicrobium sp.]|nr:hypothetical protein [Rhizomicrobium sp.]
MPGTETGDNSGADPKPGTSKQKRPRLEFAGHSIKLPGSRPLRIFLGVLLCLGGVFAFLPVLGLWMFPLGLLVLSVDIPAVDRLRHRGEIWWGRWRAARAARKAKRNSDS